MAPKGITQPENCQRLRLEHQIAGKKVHRISEWPALAFMHAYKEVFPSWCERIWKFYIRQCFYWLEANIRETTREEKRMWNHISQISDTKNLRELQEWDMTSLEEDLFFLSPESTKASYLTVYERNLKTQTCMARFLNIHSFSS